MVLVTRDLTGVVVVDTVRVRTGDIVTVGVNLIFVAVTFFSLSATVNVAVLEAALRGVVLDSC